MAKNQRLNSVIQIGGAISPTLKGAFNTINKSIGGVGKSVQDLERRQKLLGRSIREFGRAGRNVDGLRNSYAKLTQELDRTRRAQDRLAASRKRAETIVGIGGSVIRGVGVGAAAAGLVARPLVGAAINRENAVTVIRNSGVSKDEADAMVKAAQDSKQFGVSVTKAAETVSELRTALGDAHHAIEALPTALQAISGLKLYDRLHHTDMASGDSAYQLVKIAEERGGATDPASMRRKSDWAFRSVTGSNGKVGVGDLLTAVRAGKGAVQAMDDEALFGDTFLMQSMGPDRFGTSSSTWVNAWIGGHQTHGAFDHMMQLGLLNRNGVKFDKTGKVKTVSPDALVDAKGFLRDPQKWVDEHLIPLAKKQGVDLSDPAALLKFANAIASNPNVANMIVSRMRFDANIWKDRRNVAQANGIDASDQANRNSTAGKMDNARARLEDAQTRMGTVLLPAFTSAMESAASALEALNRFADESPTAFKFATVAFVGLTGAVAALTVAGGVSKLATIGLTTAMTTLGGSMDTTAGAAGRASTGLMGFLGKLGLVGVLATGALAAAKAAGLPDVDEKKGIADVRAGKWLVASAHMNPLDFARATAARFAGRSNDEIATSMANGENPANPTPKAPPMKAPPMATARSAPPVIEHTVNVGGITVNAAPTQSVHDLGVEVIRQLNRHTAVKQRSAMYDGSDH
ncbi:hypothetical protein [Paraburkholderia susongensis]|uniref:Phage-related minor tail protein n=1 Tax=Paraburkholderia susongensis TaxID=1515439 RepID=A0A1X7JJP0_9BURK|nr:hypothetical protein [Paraburkholderia susongensis]SMG28355.1 hypothetical protein SAMN06265784_102753 [Paraburkholderia susongensis]